MRKKLLALLMCATMVLGTAVTASAATSEKDAAKVYGDNYEKFEKEYYPEDSIIKADAYNGKKGTVEYGYLNDATDLAKQYTPVVVYKAGDKYKDLGVEKNEYYAAKAVKKVAKKLEVTEGTTESVAQAAERRVTEGVRNGSITADGIYAVTVKDDNANSKQVVTVKLANGAATYDNFTEGYVTNTDLYVKAPMDGDAVKANNLVKASKNILKSTDENAYGTLYANISAGDALKDDLDAVISAIDSKVFTKDAVAVKVTAYLQGTIATEKLGLEYENIYGGNAKLLYNVDKLQAGTYTFDSDLISRTAFKDAAAVNVFQPTLAKTKFDTDFGTLVKDFVKVATVEVGKTITFDNDATFVDGVFVFDKGELAAEPEADKNDGVSDTATTDNTTSPKTGDVAPIAALAVVMMGAFGAMVVASKKRA